MGVEAKGEGMDEGIEEVGVEVGRRARGRSNGVAMLKEVLVDEED